MFFLQKHKTLPKQFCFAQLFLFSEKSWILWSVASWEKKMIALFIEIEKIGWMRCTFRLFFLKLKKSWPAILLYKDIVKCWETYIFVGRSPLKLQLERELDFGLKCVLGRFFTYFSKHPYSGRSWQKYTFLKESTKFNRRSGSKWFWTNVIFKFLPLQKPRHENELPPLTSA